MANNPNSKDIINIGAEISKVAQGSAELEKKIQQMLIDGKRLSSGLQREFGEVQKKIVQQGVESQKQIDKLISSKRRLTQQERQELSIAKQLYRESAKKADILDKIVGTSSAQDGMNKSLAGSTQSLSMKTKILTGLKWALNKVVQALVKSYGIWFDLQVKTKDAMGNLAQTVSANEQQFGQLQSMFTGLQGQFQDIYGEIDEVASRTEFIEQLVSSFRQLNDTVADASFQRSIFEVGRGFGIGAEGAVKLFRDISTGVDEPIQEFQRLAVAIDDMATQLQVPASILMKDYLGARDTIAQFGRDGEVAFRNAANMANHFGLETQQILDSFKQFDTFQQASNNVNQLNAMFGTAISSFEMMMEQDPARRLDMVRQGIMGMGLEWDKMSRFQAMQLSQTLNMSEADLKRMFKDGVSFDDLEKDRARREAEQRRDENNRRSNAEKLNKILQRTSVIFENWDRIISRIWLNVSRALEPVFGEIHNATMDIGHTLEGWVNQLTESETFQKAIADIGIFIRDTWRDIVKWIQSADWDGMWRKTKETAQGFWDVLVNIWNKTKEWINEQGGLEGIWKKVKKGAKDFWDIIVDVKDVILNIKGLWEGITSSIDYATDALLAAAQLIPGLSPAASIIAQQREANRRAEENVQQSVGESINRLKLQHGPQITAFNESFPTSTRTEEGEDLYRNRTPLSPERVAAASPGGVNTTNLRTEISLNLDGREIGRKVIEQTVNEGIAGRAT